MRNLEILDIEEIFTRWDEILDRTEAGECFVISVDGQPKVRLEPIPPDEESLAETRQMPDAKRDQYTNV